MLAAFDYSNPDRMPVYYHPSPAGIHVHGQKLLDLFNEYPPDNPITFDKIPRPAVDAVDDDGRYYEERTDDWGIRWAYRIFGIQGHATGYPFNSWAEGLTYPLPPISDVGGIADIASAEPRGQYLLIDGWISLYQQLYALRPMEDVLVDMISEDPDMLAYLDRLTDFWHDVVDNLIARGIDVIMFGDDWATQSGPMVSPGIFRAHFKPRYQDLFDKIHAAGRRVFFHCCGKMGYVMDDLLGLGVDALWPQIGLYDGKELANRCRDAKAAIFIHPDRQRLIPCGTPKEITEVIARYADRYHKLGGGGIFYVEVENDAPFENVEALITAIDRYR